MTTRAKSAILIVGTLIIGAVIGALVHARFTDQRFDRLESMRSQGGLARLIERSIAFDSPEQREQVMDIVDEAAQRLFQTMQQNRRQSRAILDSTRERLGEVLSDEQMEKLERRLMRQGPGRTRDRRGHRPPHPPPPDP